MNYSAQIARSFPAIVIKNYIPMAQKVEILHYQHGKVMCMYPKSHQAAQLCAGSLVFCTVEKKHNIYTFIDLSIEFAPHGLSLEQLQFIYDIIKLCQKSIPRDICVPELFDFLLYVYRHLSELSEKGKSVAMLRLFLLLDLLPEQKGVYQIAIQDPHGFIAQDGKVLKSYVALSWDIFHQRDKAEKTY